MAGQPQLNFTLPEHGSSGRGGGGRTVTVLLVLVLIAALANLAVALLARRGPVAAQASATGATLSAESVKQLAMRLEKQGLSARAAAAWEDYLAAARPESKGSATLWYRIGKLRQEAGEYEKALESFYRSESFAKIEDLAPEIGRRCQECLESMGKFAALRQELTDRVSLKEEAKAAAGEVVAEIGAQKITKAELDREIEAQVEHQLAQYGALLPEEQRRAQKAEMLKRMAGDKERLQFLNRYVIEEVLYRKAREAQMENDPDVRAMLRDMERKVLADRVMQKEIADQVKISPADVQTYYEARKAEYRQPERARIAQILVENEEKAKAVYESLKAGKSFADIAKGVSEDAATAAKGGEVPGWVEKGGASVPGLGRKPELAAAILATETGQVLDAPQKVEKGYAVIKVLERQPARQKDFDEVRDEAYRALRSSKEREVQEHLLEELRQKYDVVIHFSKFESEKPAADQAAAPSPKAVPAKATTAATTAAKPPDTKSK